MASPGGRSPADDHVTGAVPDAVGWRVYELPAYAVVPDLGRVILGLRAGAGLGSTVRVNSLLSSVREFAAFTVNVNVPEADGVPEIVPSLARVSPPGTSPELMRHEVTPPSAVKV